MIIMLVTVIKKKNVNEVMQCSRIHPTDAPLPRWHLAQRWALTVYVPTSCGALDGRGKYGVGTCKSAPRQVGKLQ